MERYNWDQVPHEEIDSHISRQVIHTPLMTLFRVIFKKGGASAPHNHINEQITMIVSGKMRFELDGKEVILDAGDILRIPSNVVHGAAAIEDSVLVDVFSPARTDLK